MVYDNNGTIFSLFLKQISNKFMCIGYFIDIKKQFKVLL